MYSLDLTQRVGEPITCDIIQREVEETSLGACSWYIKKFFKRICREKIWPQQMIWGSDARCQGNLSRRVLHKSSLPDLSHDLSFQKKQKQTSKKLVRRFYMLGPQSKIILRPTSLNHSYHLHESRGADTSCYERPTTNQSIELPRFNLRYRLPVQRRANEFSIDLFLLCFR